MFLYYRQYGPIYFYLRGDNSSWDILRLEGGRSRNTVD